MIFLTDVAGVLDAEGAADSAAGDDASSVPGEFVGDQRRHVAEDGCVLKALRGGVDRVRIFPSEKADVLPDFYQKKIDFGTEVMVA